LNAPGQPSKRKFAKNLRWQFVANGAQALLGGIYLIFLGRTLGAANFGIFSVITAVVTVAGALLELRIQDVVARSLGAEVSWEGKSSKYRNKLLDLFALEFVSRLIPAGVVMLLAVWLQNLSKLPAGASESIMIAALGFFLSKTGNGVSTGLLRVLGRTDLLALCSTSDWALRLVFTWLLSLSLLFSINTVLWIAVAASAICNFAQVGLAVHEFHKQAKSTSEPTWFANGFGVRMRSELRLLMANWGLSVSDLMAKDLDITLISATLPHETIGLYKMAKSLVQVIWRAIDPVYLAVMPEIQKLWQTEQFQVLKRVLTKMTWALGLLSVVLIVGVYAGVSFFHEAVLGSGYSGLPAIMGLMSLWIVLCAPLIWGFPLLVAVNRPEWGVIASLCGSFIGFLTFTTLTPHYGLKGAAVAWIATLVVSATVMAGSAIWFARGKLGQQNSPLGG
jgi:O-antigen/teichoic acid export membrane protein